MERALTVRQPNASLIMADLKPVENRSWPVPSTLPDWTRCEVCGERFEPQTLATCDPVFEHLAAHMDGSHLSYRAAADGPFPFRLWIHAGQGWDHDRYRRLDQATRLEFSPDRCPRGALLGPAQVTGCHHADDGWCHDLGADYSEHCSRYAEPDCWHWTVADPEPLDEPIPMRGHQGLWKLPAGVVA